MMRKLSVLLILLGTIALTGCPKPIETQPDSSATTAADSGDDASTSGIDDGSLDTGSVVDREDPWKALLDKRVIYFDFDKSDIRREFNRVIEAHARNLSANRGATVRLEGHADERGSREYNIGLGERRAQAVRRMLLIQGATASQISTVSFGEERPAATGSDEESWALNRRVQINYGR